MTIRSTVATPTPHADYTERYNRHLENLRHRDQTTTIKRSQNRVADYYTWRHHYVDEQHRIDRARQVKAELEHIHQYEVLMRNRNYADYRYQFYIGTQFDTYI